MQSLHFVGLEREKVIQIEILPLGNIEMIMICEKSDILKIDSCMYPSRDV